MHLHVPSHPPASQGRRQSVCVYPTLPLRGVRVRHLPLGLLQKNLMCTCNGISVQALCLRSAWPAPEGLMTDAGSAQGVACMSP
jgi:hypothetical protein